MVTCFHPSVFYVLSTLNVYLDSLRWKNAAITLIVVRNFIYVYCQLNPRASYLHPRCALNVASTLRLRWQSIIRVNHEKHADSTRLFYLGLLNTTLSTYFLRKEYVDVITSYALRYVCAESTRMFYLVLYLSIYVKSTLLLCRLCDVIMSTLCLRHFCLSNIILIRRRVIYVDVTQTELRSFIYVLSLQNRR